MATYVTLIKFTAQGGVRLNVVAAPGGVELLTFMLPRQ